MSDLRLVSREFLTEFINIYQENSCLWKIKSKDYFDKRKKNAAYEVLVKKLKEVDLKSNKDAVIKRINSMRTCFRKEFKKHQMSLRSGVEEGAIYRPNLWYFDLLLFLTDQDNSRQDGMDNITETDADEIPSDILLPASVLSPPSETSASSSSSALSTIRRPIKRELDTSDHSDEFLDIVADRWQNEGKYTAYGKYVSEELQALPPKMVIYCKRIISEAIFQAQLGNLTENSKIVTTNSARNNL